MYVPDDEDAPLTLTQIFLPWAKGGDVGWITGTTTGFVFANADMSAHNMMMGIMDGISPRQLTLRPGRWVIRCGFAGNQLVTARLESRGDTLGHWKLNEQKAITIEIDLDEADTIQFSHTPLERSYGRIPS